MSVTDLNDERDEVCITLNSGSVCYHSLHAEEPRTTSNVDLYGCETWFVRGRAQVSVNKMMALEVF
jgi:hypothetical protein